MSCPEKDQTIYIREKEVKTVKTFKYLGSLFDANGGAEKDVNNRVKIAWSKWRETTRVMCDRNIPTQLKDKVLMMAIKPAMVYGAECSLPPSLSRAPSLPPPSLSLSFSLSSQVALSALL